jgi:hypothetical protein
MAIKSALFSALTTIVLILAFGNDWMIDKAAEGGDFARQTRLSVTSQLGFQFWDQPSDLRAGTIVRLLLLIVLAALFGGIVGRARPAAAFIGGWSAFLAASVVSAGVYALVVDEDFVSRPGSDTVDSFTLTASFGTSLGMWLGWLVGLAVLLGSLGRGQPKADTGRPAPAPGAWGSSPPVTSYDPPAAPYQPSGYDQPGGYAAPAPGGVPDAPQASPPPAPAPPPPAPGGPVIGSPPDRTQVFGEPPARDT